MVVFCLLDVIAHFCFSLKFMDNMLLLVVVFCLLEVIVHFCFWSDIYGKHVAFSGFLICWDCL